MKVARAFAVTTAALLSSNVAETEADWASGTTYSAAQAVKRPVGGIHRRFTSVGGSNLNHDPALYPVDSFGNPYWTDNGPTNRWQMFDQRLQLQTSNADSIHVQVQAVGRINCLYVGNISAATLRVRCTDAVEGVVYDTTVDLISTSGITDPFLYSFEPIVRVRDKGLVDLPTGYSDLLVDVWLTDTGQTVLCGELVMGLMATLGGTKWAGALGNKSYSTVDTDTFGSDFIVRRGRKRTGEFDVIVDNRHLDDVTTLLDDLDATAVLFIASDRYDAMFIFGVLLGWKEVVSWPTRTALNINLQSFTR